MPSELMSKSYSIWPLFTKPVFHHVLVLIQVTTLPPNSRTIASALRVIGKSDEKNFQSYH
jgi:hypothetical protein